MSADKEKVMLEIYPEEKRLCLRFSIPGATVSYRRERWLGQKKEFDEEFCPLQNISRGGVCFLCRINLKPGTELTMQIAIPGDRSPLNQLGEVRWSVPSENETYPYRAGVQFHPYGTGKGQNYPGNLVKIISLEYKFAEIKTGEPVGEDQTDAYEIKD